jgi:hypothetical protein
MKSAFEMLASHYNQTQPQPGRQINDINIIQHNAKTKILIDLPWKINDAIVVISTIIDTCGYPVISVERVRKLNLVDKIIPKPTILKPFGNPLGPVVQCSNVIILPLSIDNKLWDIEFAIVEHVSYCSDILIGLPQLELIGWSKPFETKSLLLGPTQAVFPYENISSNVISTPINASNDLFYLQPDDTSTEDTYLIDDTKFIPPIEPTDANETKNSVKNHSEVRSDEQVENEEITQCCPMRLIKGIRIKPMTQVYVKVKYDQNFLKKNKVKKGFVVPSLILKKTPVKLASGLFTHKSKYLLLSNMGEEEILIKANALLAYLTINEYEQFSIDEVNLDNDITCLPTQASNDFKDLIGKENSAEDDRIPVKEFVETVESLLNQDLDPDQKERFITFLKRWSILFSKNPRSPGIVTKTECNVPLNEPSQVPIRKRYYRYSPTVIDRMRKAIDEMLSNNIISKSTSPWAFPVVMATKSDGSYRFCIDYSSLTSHVKRDAYALPRIDDYLDRLKNAKYLTVVDCSSGFWQIRVNESDREKLAFITPFGNFEPNVMPFGFTNAPAIFQRAISETLDAYLFFCVLVFIDDICIYSSTFDEHLKHLEQVFTQLNKYGWKLKLQKSQFARTSIDYLGFHVGDGILKPLSRNIDKLKKIKVPDNPDALRSFLGFMGYYKRFIPGYEYKAKPLRDLLKNGTEWNWLSDHQNAYQVLLDSLGAEPILKLADYSKRFIVKTDCSQYAWGATLVQAYDVIEHPVSFASGALSLTARKWPTWKREGYAVYKAILTWSHYLMGVEFDVITDHAALLSILNPNVDLPPILDGWRVMLSRYVFKIFHRPGVSLYLEDGLSRTPEFLLMDVSLLCEEQMKSPILLSIRNYLTAKALKPTIIPDDVANFCKENSTAIDRFIIENDTLFYVQEGSKKKTIRRMLRIVIPDSLVQSIFDHYHNNSLNGAHYGLEKFWLKLSEECWAPDLFSRCRKYYNDCITCRENRTIKVKNSETLRVVATKPNQVLQMDHVIVDVETPEGYKYILSVQDVCSRKLWLFAVKTLTAEETFIILLEQMFYVDDFPDYFISDMGGAFDSALSKLICSAANISHEFNLPNRNTKGATGQLENKHRTVWNILRKYVDQISQSNWNKYLPIAATAHNRTPCSSLNNYTPNEVYYGRKPKAFFDFDKLIDPTYKNDDWSTYVNDMKSIYVNIYDDLIAYQQVLENKKSKINREIHSWKVGDYARIRREENTIVAGLNVKLATKTQGPFEVISVQPNRNRITLRITPTKNLTVHYDDCVWAEPKPLNPDEFSPELTEIIPNRSIPPPRNPPKVKKSNIRPETDKSQYDVKSIVGQRIRLLWNSGKAKGWWTGTVIGYDASLKFNLVYYDIRSQNTSPMQDYYKSYLYPTGKRKDTWDLITV